MAAICSICEQKAIVKCAFDGKPACRLCFVKKFEDRVHESIVEQKIFNCNDRVAVGASGGKDSTVLAYILKVLNERHNYGLELHLLSIDEGIKGYRDDSLKAVERNKVEYDLPLTILSYKELYGWNMDEIVAKIGTKNNCTFCGVFRRQALERGALRLKATKIATGHNADDVAETVLMNILRGDTARLLRRTDTTILDNSLPRVKPLKYMLEKDVVMYAYIKKLDYFSTECVYAPNSFRGLVRDHIKEIERIMPASILNIVKSGDEVAIYKSQESFESSKCIRCGFLTSQELCKACLLTEGLNTNNYRLGVKKTKKTVGCTAKKCECSLNDDTSELF